MAGTLAPGWIGLFLLAGCTVGPETSRSDAAQPLIPSGVVAALDARGTTREDCTARLGTPSMVGADGRFLEYDRSALYRNLSRTGPGGARGASVGSQPDVVYYQLVGIWLDPGGHVIQAREFVSPCASCAEGEMLLSMAKLADWMRTDR